jgi:ERCC4-type nuclease
MLGKYKFTDKELKILLDSLTVIIDTREQENSHITEYLNKKKISYKGQKLDFGDYSFMIPANEKLCIMRDLHFTDNIVIERKAHLNEISGNLTADGGTRFEQELIKSQGAKFYLMIENASYADIINHNYNTQYEPKAFVARLKTFESRYGISINFVSSKCSGNFIYHTFYYWLREQLKRGELHGSTLPMPHLPE